MDKEIWAMTLERLARELPGATMSLLRRGRLISSVAPDQYVLHLPGSAATKQISKRFLSLIERALSDVVGIKAVRITIQPTANKPIKEMDAHESLFPDTEEAPLPVAVEAIPPRITRPNVPPRPLRNANGGYANNHGGAAPSTITVNAPPRQRFGPPPPDSAPPVDQYPPIDSSSWLNDRYTFDTFIVGGSNKFAYAACMAVAEHPGEAYNPLFLYGGVGLGKTHLMHAIAHAVAPAGSRTLYVTSETFTNEIVNAIRYRTTEEFRAKYRSVDVLLVDDVQFIAGKGSTEEEFFHTFNTLHESRKQIVMCSDRPPREIDLEERLRSRFEWGLIADVQAPDLETRLAILRAKADESNRIVDDAVLTYLAERVQNNVRALEGMLTRVVALADLQHAPLTVELAKQALASISQADKPKRRVSVGEVLEAVSNYYHVSIEDLRGKQRDKHIVMPRQVAMWLMRADTEASLMEIGQSLGGRDHSTILHGCDKIEQELKREDSPLVQEIQALRHAIIV